MNPFLVAKRRPLVVGHRGVPALHQENTLAGFRRAAVLGADAVELDVRITRDGQPVVFHDRTLERLTGIARPISDLTWDEVSALRIPRTIPIDRGRRVLVSYEHEERIPLLAEVLAAIGQRLLVNIELKARWFDDGISRAVARVIAGAGMCERVLVTSFSPRRLREIRRFDPRIAVGFCWDASMLGFAGALGRRILNHLLDTNLAGQLLGLRAVGAEHTLVGPDTVRRVHGAGVAVGTHVLFPIGARNTATIATSPVEVRRLADLGVDWIESDDPEQLLRLVA